MKEDTIKTKLFIKNVPVTRGQYEVYNVLAEHDEGLPDHALVPLAQHVAHVRLSSSGIRTRRKELVDMGLVKPLSREATTGSGRHASVYKAVA